jgi:RNA polymerase sigma factor (sigma-70 family)
VAQNIYLVKWFAKKWYGYNHPYYDEVVSVAQLGLMRAAKTWRPDKGAFSTYAVQWMRTWASKEVERLEAIYYMERSGPASSPKSGEEFHVVEHQTTAHEPREVFWKKEEIKENNRKIQQTLDRMPEKERELLRDVYFRGLTRKDVGDREGFCRFTISLRVKKALGIFKKIFTTLDEYNETI